MPGSHRVVHRARRRFKYVQEDEHQPPKLHLLTHQSMLKGEPVPERKFIVHRVNPKDDNPYGTGLGLQLFWPVFFKRKGVVAWNKLCDRFGSPTPHGKYPKGASRKEKDTLADALRAMSSDGYLMTPEGMEIALIESKLSGNVTTQQQLCEYMDDWIAAVLMGLLYHPDKALQDDAKLSTCNNQPLAATAVAVWSPTCVNIAGFDSQGSHFTRTSVLFWDGIGNRPAGRYVELREQPGELIAGGQVTGSPHAVEIPNRVTPQQIDALMEAVNVRTHCFPGTTSTVAIAALPDGFVIGIGHSACIDPANFDAEIGARIATADALKKARDKAWELEGYLLRDKRLQADANNALSGV